MIIVLLNTIGGLAVALGIYNMTNSILYAVLGTVILNGAPFLWMIHSIWYVALELFVYHYLTIYGYTALTSYILIILISAIGAKLAKRGY